MSGMDARPRYDIVFVGHICHDELLPYQAPPIYATGSAVLCGALAAGRVGARTAVVTRMAVADEDILRPLHEAGVRTYVVPAPETTRMRVVHPTEDLDEREMFQAANAGYFRPEDIPDIGATFLHLAGITNQEFTLDLIRGLRQRGYSLSTDMQSFVRQVDPRTREVKFADVPDKRAIVALLDRVKLDVVEAKILTGESDLERAAVEIESWGCPEVVITRAEGVLARAGGRTHYERCTNRNSSGRTGRGDTTFAAYMVWRLAHPPAEALAFASALVSIKMEQPTPFAGTLDDVLKRLAEAPAAR